jgi:hypothetical protein
MDVTLPHPPPVDELDAELERGVGRAHEFVFIEPEQPVEVQNLRDGGFTHADDADGIGFDDLNPDLWSVQQFRKGGSRHPSGRPAADDHDVANSQIGHGWLRRDRRRNSAE